MSLTRVTHRPCTLWVVVISVNGEHGDSNVQIWVFIVDSWEAMKVTIRTSAAQDDAFGTHEYPAGFPSLGSLRSSICIGRSPRVYSRSKAMTWYRQSLEGLFSWKRSPARRMKSTLSQKREGEVSC